MFLSVNNLLRAPTCLTISNLQVDQKDFSMHYSLQTICPTLMSRLKMVGKETFERLLKSKEFFALGTFTLGLARFILKPGRGFYPLVEGAKISMVAVVVLQVANVMICRHITCNNAYLKIKPEAFNISISNHEVIGNSYYIFQYFIASEIGKRWLSQAVLYHGSEDLVFQAYVNLFSIGPCHGFVAGLLHSASINANQPSLKLIEDMDLKVVAWNQFAKTLNTKACFLPKAGLIPELSYCTIYKDFLAEPNEFTLFSREFANPKKIENFYLFKEYIHLRSNDPLEDIKDSFSSSDLEAPMETILEKIEIENPKAIVCCRLAFNFHEDFNHCVFAQVNGDFIRLACHTKGLYEFRNLQEFYRGVFNYLNHLENKVNGIEVLFYVNSSVSYPGPMD